MKESRSIRLDQSRAGRPGDGSGQFQARNRNDEQSLSTMAQQVVARRTAGIAARDVDQVKQTAAETRAHTSTACGLSCLYPLARCHGGCQRISLNGTASISSFYALREENLANRIFRSGRQGSSGLSLLPRCFCRKKFQPLFRTGFAGLETAQG
jgi:hypothetical protein